MDIESSPRGLLTAFFRQSKTFLLVFAVILTASLAYVMSLKPVYEARGSMVVKFGKDSRSEANVGDRGNYSDSDAAARQEIILSYIKIMSSRDLLRDIVSDFGPYRLYRDLEKNLPPGISPEEAALNSLIDGDLRIGYDKSHLIEVSVYNGDPEVATEFASRVMASFIRKRTEIYNTPQTSFLEQQIEEARQKLEVSQKNFLTFKQEVGVSDIDEEIAQLLREKTDLSAVAFASVTEAQAKLSELEAQEAEMRATYRSTSPMLIRLQQMVAVARADLQRRQSDLNASDSGNSFSTKKANVDKRLSYLESQRGRYNDLHQKVRIDEDNYLFYVKRGEEARINNLLNRQNITSISVVDNPITPSIPVKPQRNILLAITLLAAMMAATGAALSRELLDDRLTSPEQVYSALGIPVLATFEKEKAI